MVTTLVGKAGDRSDDAITQREEPRKPLRNRANLADRGFEATSSLRKRWKGGRAPRFGASQKPVGGAVKRLVDIGLSSFAIIATFPVMAAVAVLCSFGGAPIYSHKRVGHSGRVFHCFKFRTMVRDGDEVLQRLLNSDEELARRWKTHRKIPNDPRVTRIGHFLRKSSLDELPQLFNVLRGDMSCVGPRPVTPEELGNYGINAEKYTSVRPGLTGLWQVSGRNEVSFDERVQIDVSYIEKWSIWSDLLIMFRTPTAILRFRSTH